MNDEGAICGLIGEHFEAVCWDPVGDDNPIPDLV